jgi:hypothetical protein
MSDFTDNEDKQLVQLVRDHELQAPKGTRIPWTAIGQKMQTKKHPEQLRLRFRCLRRRFGESAVNFPRRYFLRIQKIPIQKEVEEDICVWRQRLQDGYADIRRDQNAYDKLVLGHGHMYGELIPSRLIQIFEIFRNDCHFNSSSVFVDFGCGLGKVAFLLNKCICIYIFLVNLLICLGCLYGIQEQDPRKYRN